LRSQSVPETFVIKV